MMLAAWWAYQKFSISKDEQMLIARWILQLFSLEYFLWNLQFCGHYFHNCYITKFIKYNGLIWGYILFICYQGVLHWIYITFEVNIRVTSACYSCFYWRISKEICLNAVREKKRITVFHDPKIHVFTLCFFSITSIISLMINTFNTESDNFYILNSNMYSLKSHNVLILNLLLT